MMHALFVNLIVSYAYMDI